METRETPIQYIGPKKLLLRSNILETTLFLHSFRAIVVVVYMGRKCTPSNSRQRGPLIFCFSRGAPLTDEGATVKCLS